MIILAITGLCVLITLTTAPHESGKASASTLDQVFESYGAIPWGFEKARLDNFSIQLHQDKNLIGYILVYNGRRMCPGEAQARAIRAKRYVVEHRGVEWNRVIWREDGYSENILTVLQPVSRGTILPYQLLSTLPGNKVEIVKNCGARIKQIRQSKW
jgi:hypothetical protein